MIELYLYCMVEVEKESPINTDRIILLDEKRIAWRIPKWSRKMQNQTLPSFYEDPAESTHVASSFSPLGNIDVTKRQVTAEHDGMVRTL